MLLPFSFLPMTAARTAYSSPRACGRKNAHASEGFWDHTMRTGMLLKCFHVCPVHASTKPRGLVTWGNFSASVLEQPQCRQGGRERGLTDSRHSAQTCS